MTYITDIPMDDHEITFKALSLYTGAGGLDTGFYRAGITPIWANDIDPYAIETYNRFFKTSHGNVGDIRDQILPEDDVDVVIGGPPCQGFSVAGKMDPNDPRSKHVWDFLGVVKKKQPEIFVMENVKSLAVNRRWKNLLNSLIEESEKIGYRTNLWLLNASHYGVPQARERMFLVGSKDGKLIQPPLPVSEKNPPSAKEFLKKLPQYGTDGNNTTCVAKITLAKNPILRKSPFAGMLFNGQGRPLNIEVPSVTLHASMGGNRTPIIDQKELDEGADPWVVNYHQSLISKNKRTDKVPPYLRRMTVEESSILQTFSIGMEFSGTTTTKFRQIGNAVPPELGYHVARKIYSELLEQYSNIELDNNKELLQV